MATDKPKWRSGEGGGCEELYIEEGGNGVVLTDTALAFDLGTQVTLEVGYMGILQPSTM